MSDKLPSINSRLFKLKEWLLVPETAQYLSTLFNEEVKNTDVLQLALDKHVTLSVNFVNHTPLDSRAETTYLNIIGAMLEIFVHKDHDDVNFPSETKLREFLSERYAGFKGLTERTLAEKFAAAKKAIREEFD